MSSIGTKADATDMCRSAKTAPIQKPGPTTNMLRAIANTPTVFYAANQTRHTNAATAPLNAGKQQDNNPTGPEYELPNNAPSAKNCSGHTTEFSVSVAYAAPSLTSTDIHHLTQKNESLNSNLLSNTAISAGKSSPHTTQIANDAVQNAEGKQALFGL